MPKVTWWREDLRFLIQTSGWTASKDLNPCVQQLAWLYGLLPCGPPPPHALLRSAQSGCQDPRWICLGPKGQSRCLRRRACWAASVANGISRFLPLREPPSWQLCMSVNVMWIVCSSAVPGWQESSDACGQVTSEGTCTVEDMASYRV